MDELRRAADLFAVGELPAERLSYAAAEALARGHDTPALLDLACLHVTDSGPAPGLFRAAMAELGIVADENGWVTREAEVRLRRAKEHATALLSGADIAGPHLGGLIHQLSVLASFPEASIGDPGVLWNHLEALSDYLAADIGDFEALRATILRGCRSLLAGPPYEPILNYQPSRPSLRARWGSFNSRLRNRGVPRRP
ncbi:hypothetical protein ACFC06_23825 [Nocardia sp. NPDC056064]|uniref:hypothetical protein n=1 Tax=Nocardia sp. NPDC056064 TaxID=3345701 RepID=UPI0035D63176